MGARTVMYAKHWIFRLLLGAALVTLLLLSAQTAAAQTLGSIDYDDDNNGYIDLRTPAQLAAVQYDENGNGQRDDVPQAVWTDNYVAAFPTPLTGMGCPNSGCLGYELRRSLDLSGYANWSPIDAYSAVFRGNDYTLSNLTITGNASDNVGLFGQLKAGAQVLRLGISGADVTGTTTFNYQEVGILAGENRGSISYSYTTGTVAATGTGTGHSVGGLTGMNVAGANITASYSTAAVNGPAGGTGHSVGGLVGLNGNVSTGGSIHTSYASGAVAVTAPGDDATRAGGLVGHHKVGSITNSYAYGAVSVSSGSRAGGLTGQQAAAGANISRSYYDSQTTGQAGAGAGKTTRELQEVTGYSGIYADWNVNLDGLDGADDPWVFGAASDYPRLRVNGEPLAPQTSTALSSLDAGGGGGNLFPPRCPAPPA